MTSVQQPGFPQPAISLGIPARQTPVPEGRWGGIGVTLMSGVTLFFKSLDCRYKSDHLQKPGQQIEIEPPSFGLGTGNTSKTGGSNGFFQGVELGARLILAYATLPAEVSTLIGGLVSLSAATRCGQDALETPAAKTGPDPVFDDEDGEGGEGGENVEQTTNKEPDILDQKAQKKLSGQQPAPLHQSGRLTKTAVSLGALSSLAIAGASPSFASTSEPAAKAVSDAETLGKIGRDPDYPLNGTYHQTADIDASNLTSIGEIQPFTGLYDGQCHTIANLKHCLVRNLGQEGNIENLRFTDANITSTETTGVVACAVEGKVNNIMAESAYISTLGDFAHAGIGGGHIEEGGSVSNIMTVNCRVSTSGRDADAGIGGGSIQRVFNSPWKADSPQVNPDYYDENFQGRENYEGYEATVSNTTAINSTVSTSGGWAYAGIGGGYIRGGGTISSTMAVNSKVFTTGEKAKAGIGVGGIEYGGTVSNTTAVNCNVSTSGGWWQHAGIGGGEIDNGGRIEHTTAVNCTVSTDGSDSHAGIGVGLSDDGTVSDTTAVNSKVSAMGVGEESGVGKSSSAGIGVGENYGGRVERITAVNSRASIPSGGDGHAGIGAGWIASGSVSDITAVNSTVSARGWRANASIGGKGRGTSSNIMAVNCTVNGATKNQGDTSNLQLSELCKTADRRVLTTDCQPRSPYLDVSTSQDFANPDICPVNTGTLTSDITAATECYDFANDGLETANNSTITVANAETLQKIGRQPDFPLNGTYTQTRNINAINITEPIDRFTGQYNGQCHTIENLDHCLIKSLDGNGTLSNIRFNRARVVQNSGPAAVIACTMDGNARIQHSRVDNSSLATFGHNLNQAHAGLGTGYQMSRDNLITDLVINNSSVKTRGGDNYAGGVAGFARGQISGTIAENTHVTTRGRGANAAIVAGRISGHSEIKNSQVFNCTVRSRGDNADTGITVGRVNDHGKVDGTDAAGNRVKSRGLEAHTGVAAGAVYDHGEVSNTLSIENNVTSLGYGADAAVAAGEIRNQGDVRNTLAVRSSVKTLGSEAEAAIGAGEVSHRGQLTNTTAFESSVIARKYGADAAIGAGIVRDLGQVHNTSSYRSSVKALGELSKAGIGAGANTYKGLVKNTLSVNSSVRARYADIPSGLTENTAQTLNTTIVNSRVNGELRYSDSSPQAFDINPDQLCDRVSNQSFVNKDCQINTGGLYAVQRHHQGHGSYSRIETISVDVAPHKDTSALAGTAAPIATTTFIGLAAVTGAALGLCGYQYYTGYREGQRGWDLAIRPLTKGAELVKTLVKSSKQKENKQAHPDCQMVATGHSDVDIQQQTSKRVKQV